MKYYNIQNSTGKHLAGPVALGNSKEIKFLKNECELIHSWGANYNGYGYEDHNYVYRLTRNQVSQWNRLRNAPKKAKKILTEEEIITTWARRLAKLSDISLEDALNIAEEKLEYKERQIDMMRERQYERESTRREKLINKMIRENPLRRIVDEDHARAIIAASERHNNTDYELKLKYARELVDEGEIERDEVKEWARENYQKSAAL